MRKRWACLFALVFMLPGFAVAQSETPPPRPLVAAEIPTTKAECEQAEMRWDEQANKCRPAFGKPMLPAPVRHVLGIIGMGSALLGLILLYREWRDQELRLFAQERERRANGEGADRG